LRRYRDAPLLFAAIVLERRVTRDEQHPLPESVGGLVVLALQAYGKRIGAYTALALASIVVQGLVVVAWPKNLGANLAASTCADALIAAFATIGVIADLGTKGQSTRTIFSHAVQRWWILAAIGVVQLSLQILFFSEIAGTPKNALDVFSTALTGVMITLIYCALIVGTVVAAIDTTTRSLFIVPASIGRGLAVALAWPNISRLMILAALVVAPIIITGALDDQFKHLHIAKEQADFWAGVPIDALTTGPLQALFSVFYLDFVRRLISRAHVP
jgi:hypothetical protein